MLHGTCWDYGPGQRSITTPGSEEIGLPKLYSPVPLFDLVQYCHFASYSILVFAHVAAQGPRRCGSGVSCRVRCSSGCEAGRFGATAVGHRLRRRGGWGGAPYATRYHNSVMALAF